MRLRDAVTGVIIGGLAAAAAYIAYAFLVRPGEGPAAPPPEAPPPEAPPGAQPPAEPVPPPAAPPPAEPAPPPMMVQLSVDKTRVMVGGEVEAVAVVAGAAGSYTVELLVNGVVVRSTRVLVDGGRGSASFRVRFDSAGTYHLQARVVEVDEFSNVVEVDVSAPAEPGFAVIRGFVRDAVTGRPISGATVIADGHAVEAGYYGRYEIRIRLEEPASLIVAAWAPLYERESKRVTASPGSEVRVDFWLKPS